MARASRCVAQAEEEPVKRILHVLLLGVFLAGPACSKFRSGGSADPSERSVNGPVVRLQGSQVLVDGKAAGSTRTSEEIGRIQKINELFDELKMARELFKVANPAKPFSGRATIVVDSATPAVAFKSVFQTVAFAGYPALVEIGGGVGGGSNLLPVGAIVPGLPHETSGTPRVALHLRLQDDALQVVEERGGVVVTEDRLEAGDAAGLRTAVHRAIVSRFLRRDLRADPTIGVIVHTENSLSYQRLAALFAGLRDAHGRLAGPGDEGGAFGIRLAMD
jgi:hypothetical protein